MLCFYLNSLVLQKVKAYELKGLMVFSVRVDVIMFVTSSVSISFLTVCASDSELPGRHSSRIA